MAERKGAEILKRFGATDIEPYVLCSNYGYKFKIHGADADIRFWANLYGCYIGAWGALEQGLKGIERAFNREIGEDPINW